MSLVGLQPSDGFPLASGGLVAADLRCVGQGEAPRCLRERGDEGGADGVTPGM
jgi:hypothetical protein